jgi:hypothetical protein
MGLNGVILIIATSGCPNLSSGFNAYLMPRTGGNSEPRNIVQNFPTTSTERTMAVFLRRGTNDFAQILGGIVLNIFVNFNLATRVVGPQGSAVTKSAIQPWKHDWYRCTLTTSSSIMVSMAIAIFPHSNALRNASSLLVTSMYIAEPHMEIGSFVTS